MFLEKEKNHRNSHREYNIPTYAFNILLLHD